MTKSRTHIAVFVGGLLVLVGFTCAWTLSPSVRTIFKWSLCSSLYKKQVLDQPPTADGYLKHIEWDGWGFPGAGNTVVYLVFDPSDQLSSATANGKDRKFLGLPCEVSRVSKLDKNWYTVRFYTDTQWK